MSTITDVKTARALVKFERDRNTVVYAEYIAANAVTLETVSDHVKALAELAFPGFTPDSTDEEKAERKAFMNRVRNGLNHRLGKRTPSQEAATASTEPEETAEEHDTLPEVQSLTAAVAGLERALIAARDAGLDREAAEFWVQSVYATVNA